jgi:hypothetical protein
VHDAGRRSRREGRMAAPVVEGAEYAINEIAVAIPFSRLLGFTFACRMVLFPRSIPDQVQ